AAERYARAVADFVVDEFLAEDRPLVDPVIPDEVEAPAPAAAPHAITAEPTAVVVAQIGAPASPLPPALRHLADAASLPNPRGRGRAVPTGRFAGEFSDEIRAETALRIATWWGEVKPETRA